MINGGHIILYSKDAARDKEFFKSVLKFGHVDAGEGWLIFKLPPAEIAVHPSDENDVHEFYLMCDDLNAEIARLKQAGVKCEEPMARGWGMLTQIHLPVGAGSASISPGTRDPRFIAHACRRAGRGSWMQK